MSTKKIKCECKKNAIIIENKVYYCATCYINKFIRVHQRHRYKPNNNSGENTVKRI